MRHSIPRLWAYFILDQILPVSFTQNLFSLFLLLRRHDSYGTTRLLRPLSSNLQILLVFTFGAVLGMGSYSVKAGWLFPVLFVTRLLLFSPFLLLQPAVLPADASARSRFRSLSAVGRLGRHEGKWALGLTIASIAFQLRIGLSQYSVTEISSALNSSSAVSALGYDVLLGISSLAVYAFMGNEAVESSTE